MKSYLKEKGLIWMLFQNKYSLPSFSIRNILVLLIYFIMVAWYILLFPIIYLPFISLLFIYGSVLLTSPFAIARRGNIVARAKNKLKDKKLKIVAITGSFGKTSVKEYLYAILTEKFNVAKTDKNQNTDVGVALGVLNNVQSNTEIFIAEIGAYTTNEISRVVNWLHPQYAILSGIGNQHLDLFGSQENLIKAKLEIAGGNTETFYFNKDTISEDVVNKHVAVKNLISYSSDDLPLPFANNLPGAHSQLNLVPCVMLARSLGMTDIQIGNAIQKLQPIKGKLSQHFGINSLVFIDDSYNSSVDGFLAALNFLYKSFSNKPRYVVTKGIIELGSAKESSYKSIKDAITITNTNLITIDKDLGTTLLKTESDIFRKILSLPADSVVLIEGRFSKKFMDQLLLK